MEHVRQQRTKWKALHFPWRTYDHDRNAHQGEQLAAFLVVFPCDFHRSPGEAIHVLRSACFFCFFTFLFRFFSLFKSFRQLGDGR
jgi:hypothetical protein